MSDSDDRQQAAPTLPDRVTSNRTAWFFRVIVPAIWFVAALVSWKHPGDEYLLFQLVTGLPAAWVPLLFGPVRGSAVIPAILMAGLVTVALFGWLMDRLRVGRIVWAVLLAIGIPALLLWGLSQYPSYEQALAKNGSLMTYIAASTNLSLYLASLLALSVTIARAIVRRILASGLRRSKPSQ